MILYTNINVNQVYNFKVKPTGILELEFNSAKLLASANYDMAILVRPDIDQIHAAIWSRLATGVSLDPRSLDYYIIKTSSGVTTVLAQEWLSTAPELVEEKRVVVTIDRLSADKVALVRSALISRGITDFTIDTTN